MIVRVHWDTSDNEIDGDRPPRTAEACGLPEIVDVPDDLHQCECGDDCGGECRCEAGGGEITKCLCVADWLSDRFGFCVYGWRFVTGERAG